MNFLYVILLILFVIFIAMAYALLRAPRAIPKTGAGDDTVFHIEGHPGVGKTTLCQRLMSVGIKCVDVDDIYNEVISNLLDDPQWTEALKRRDAEAVADPIKSRVTDKVQKILQSGDVVLVGSYNDKLPPGVQKYYIQEEPKTVFRRVHIRTVEKICSTKDKLIDVYKNADVELIPTIVGHKCGVNIHYWDNYDDFADNFCRYQSTVESMGYKPATFDAILRLIKSRLRPSS